MNRGDTRPPGVPRFFAVRKFDCRDRMERGGRKRGREKNSFPIDFYCLVIVRRPRVPLLLLVSLNSYAIFGNILIGSEIMIIYFIALRRSYCWKCFVSFVERELCSRSVGDDLQLIDELFPLF